MAVQMSAPATTLIIPRCQAHGCSVAGDQYTMVRCRKCDGWYCSDHIAIHETVRLITVAAGPAKGLSYYVGICARCQRT